MFTAGCSVASMPSTHQKPVEPPSAARTTNVCRPGQRPQEAGHAGGPRHSRSGCAGCSTLVHSERRPGGNPGCNARTKHLYSLVLALQSFICKIQCLYNGAFVKIKWNKTYCLYCTWYTVKLLKTSSTTVLTADNLVGYWVKQRRLSTRRTLQKG